VLLVDLAKGLKVLRRTSIAGSQPKLDVSCFANSLNISLNIV
jgi:hypothetical protein